MKKEEEKQNYYNVFLCLYCAKLTHKTRRKDGNLLTTTIINYSV